MKRSANGAVEARDGRKRKRRRRRHGRESLHPGNGAPLQQSDLEPVSSDDDLPQRLVSDQYLEEISDEEPNFHESDSEDDLVIRQCEIVTPLIERSQDIPLLFAEKLRVWTESFDFKKRDRDGESCVHLVGSLLYPHAVFSGPPLEKFIGVNAVERKKAFLEFVTPGDCVVGRISRIVDGHAELNVLAFEKPKNREVWDLGIKGRLDAQNALKITDEEDPLHGYRVGDILRCEVLGLTISNNTLDLGMLGEKMCSTSSLPLKRIEVEELPETYVRSCRISRGAVGVKAYEIALFENPSFHNVKCGESFLRKCGLAPTTAVSFMPSARFMAGLSTSDLRDMQAARHASGLVRSALTLISNGALDEALGCLDEATGANPSNAAAFLARGAIHAGRHDYQLAIEDFRRVLSIDASQQSAVKCLSDALAAYARECMKQNLACEARKAYQECLGLQPGHKEAQLALRTVLSISFDPASRDDSRTSEREDDSREGGSSHAFAAPPGDEPLSFVVYEDCENDVPLMKITQETDFEFVLEDFDAFTPTATLDNLCDDFQTSSWKARVGVRCYKVTFVGPPVEFQAFGSYVSEVLGGFLGKPRPPSRSQHVADVVSSESDHVSEVSREKTPDEKSDTQESPLTANDILEVSETVVSSMEKSDPETSQRTADVIEEVGEAVVSSEKNTDPEEIQQTASSEEVNESETAGESTVSSVNDCCDPSVSVGGELTMEVEGAIVTASDVVEERTDDVSSVERSHSPPVEDPVHQEEPVDYTDDVDEPFPSPSPPPSPSEEEPPLQSTVVNGDSVSTCGKEEIGHEGCQEPTDPPQPSSEVSDVLIDEAASSKPPCTNNVVKRAPLRIAIPKKCPEVPYVPILKNPVLERAPSPPRVVVNPPRKAVQPPKTVNNPPVPVLRKKPKQKSKPKTNPFLEPEPHGESDSEESDKAWKKLTDAERVAVLRVRVKEVSDEMDACTSFELYRWIELKARVVRLLTRIHKLQTAIDDRSQNARSRLPEKVKRHAKHVETLWLVVDRLHEFVGKQSAYFVTLDAKKKEEWLDAAKSLDAIWKEVRDAGERLAPDRRDKLYTAVKKLVNCFGETRRTANDPGDGRMPSQGQASSCGSSTEPIDVD